MKTNIAPLKGGYMITSMLGAIISLLYVLPRDPTWGFLAAAIFIMMFIASMISMTYGPDEAMLHTGHELARRRARKSAPKPKKKKKK